MAPWVALWADSSPLMMPFSPSDPASSETRTPPSTPIHRCTSLIGSQPLCLATTSGIRTILSANKTNSTWVTKSCFILCTHQVPRLDHKITIWMFFCSGNFKTKSSIFAKSQSGRESSNGEKNIKGFEGCHVNALIESFKMSPHLIGLRWNSKALLWPASWSDLENG